MDRTGHETSKRYKSQFTVKISQEVSHQHVQVQKLNEH